MTESLNIFLFVFLYLFLIWKAGKTYPIMELFIFIYFVQYVFSTYLVYTDYNREFHKMPVGQEEYFSYAIPALLCLFGGVILFNKNYDVRHVVNHIDPAMSAKVGYLLLSISLVFDGLVFLGLGFLESVVSFTTYLKYVAAFCFLFTESKLKYLLIGLIYSILAYVVLREGVFISFFVWATYLFFFIVLKFRISYWLRLSFIFVAVPMVIVVQSVKEEYREVTWSGQREGGVELFTELAEKNTDLEEPFAETEGTVSTIGRLTQGWHLGLTMRRVPRHQDFANGQEMFDDVIASLVPRIFFSDKKKVNSQEKFYKYTGYRLGGTTSMSIGILGDFYVNYGRSGSYVMLFIFGALLAISFNYFIRRFVYRNPINIVWIPFILNYLIRANNDFYIFFNGLVKGLIIFLLIQYVIYRIFKFNTSQRVRLSQPV